MYNGGGICNTNSSPTIADCTFSNNEPADIWSNGGSLLVTRCTFAGDFGGIVNESCIATITDCKFTGGGIRNNSGSATVRRCSFEEGWMYNRWCDAVVTHCTFSMSYTGMFNEYR